MNAKILLNSQIAHFIDDASPFCTWCNFYPLHVVPKETHSHFFFHCPTVYPIIDKYFTNFYGEPLDLVRLFFKGYNSDNKIESNILNLEVSIFLFVLYNLKNRKKIPNYGSISCAVALTKKSLALISPTINKWYKWIEANKVGRALEHIQLMYRMPFII